MLAAIVLAGPLAGGSAIGAPLPTELDLSQYKGKVVYIDFWASWCGPCKLSFPYMQGLEGRLPKSSFVLIAVNVDHARDQADAFLRQYGSSVPVVFDPKGVIASKYQVKAMPTSILIGRDGSVRYVHNGFFPAETANYDNQIEKLINEK